MNLFPTLSLRASEEAEIDGIDEAEIGEFAYDYVEKERDYIHASQAIEGSHIEALSSIERSEEKSTYS